MSAYQRLRTHRSSGSIMGPKEPALVETKQLRRTVVTDWSTSKVKL